MKKELNEIKEKVEITNKKLHELTSEELDKVNGGIKLDPERLRRKVEGSYASY